MTQLESEVLSLTIECLRSKIFTLNNEEFIKCLENTADVVADFQIFAKTKQELNNFDIIFSIKRDDDTICKKLIKFMMSFHLTLVTNNLDTFLEVEEALNIVEKYLKIQDMEMVSNEMICLANMLIWVLGDLKDKSLQVSKGGYCEKFIRLVLDYVKYIHYQMRKSSQNNQEWKPSEAIIDLFAGIYEYLPFNQWYWNEWDHSRELGFEFLQLIYELSEHPEFSDDDNRMHQLCTCFGEEAIKKLELLIIRDAGQIENLKATDIVPLGQISQGTPVWKIVLKIANALFGISSRPLLSPSILFGSKYISLFFDTLKVCPAEIEETKLGIRLINVLIRISTVITPSRIDDEVEEEHFTRLEDSNIIEQLIDFYPLAQISLKEPIIKAVTIIVRRTRSMSADTLVKALNICITEEKMDELLLVCFSMYDSDIANQLVLSEHLYKMIDKVFSFPVTDSNFFDQFTKFNLFRDSVDDPLYDPFFGLDNKRILTQMKGTFKDMRSLDNSKYLTIMRWYSGLIVALKVDINHFVKEFYDEYFYLVGNLQKYLPCLEMEIMPNEIFRVLLGLCMGSREFTEKVSHIILELFFDTRKIEKEEIVPLIEYLLVNEILTKPNTPIIKKIEQRIPLFIKEIREGKMSYLVLLCIVYPYFPNRIFGLFCDVFCLQAMISFIDEFLGDEGKASVLTIITTSLFKIMEEMLDQERYIISGFCQPEMLDSIEEFLIQTGNVMVDCHNNRVRQKLEIAKAEVVGMYSVNGEDEESSDYEDVEYDYDDEDDEDDEEDD